MVLAHLVGNRAAVYGLRIPLTPAEAVNRAVEQLVMLLVAELVDQAAATAPTANPDRRPGAEPATASPSPSGPAADRTPPGHADPQQSPAPGDINGTPTGFGFVFGKSGVGGYARASATVDILGTIPADSTKTAQHLAESGTGTNQRTALRAGSEASSGPDWALTVPTSGFAGLIRV